MKILYFGGGLGNQIFEYTFYLALRDKFPIENIYGVYPKYKFKEHDNGFEIENIFDVKFPQTKLIAKILIVLIFLWKKIYPKTKLCSLHNTEVNWNSIVFNAFKSDLSFYEKRKNWIKYKSIILDEKNQSIVQLMADTSSVSVHVRRGDFLSDQYASKLSNIATPKYYNDAIKFIFETIETPFFFIFSDDIKWCKDHLNLTNSIYVDWNTGKNSYLDMYLMTHCKANIIANSTFSYWGAFLNKNNPIVLYPKKWINADYYPNIFPEKWYGIES